MNKITFRSCLFVLIAGMFLLVSGCGYRCERWATRIAYRQVCRGYSSDGNCSLWGTESYQDTYCTKWIKDPGSKKRSRSKSMPLKLILKAGKAYFPKIPSTPTDGETYLLTQLTPFLCEIMKSDDIVKTLSSMGQCKIDNEKSKYWDFQYDYLTKSYTGRYNFTVDDPPIKSLPIRQTNGKSWAFSKDELIDWLSSLGLDVFQYGSTYIYGVAGHTGGDSIYNTDLGNYPFCLWMTLSSPRGKYGGINYYAPKIFDNFLGLNWKNQSKAKTVFCKEWSQKLKSLPQKEQKQRRETIKNQVKITTQGLTASELNGKALALWKGGQFTDPDRAIAYLSKAIRLDSKYAKAYINRGIAWYNKGNYDRAISDYNKAIELNPRFAEAYINRGVAWYNKGNYDRAVSDYNKAIELKPTYALAYNNRGFAWKRKGNYDRSCHDYQKACELGLCKGLNRARKEGYCK